MPYILKIIIIIIIIIILFTYRARKITLCFYALNNTI